MSPLLKLEQKDRCVALSLDHVNYNWDNVFFFQLKAISITNTRLFKYIENFTSKKQKFSDKKILIFFQISAQNIDCGCSLEPPRRGGSYEYPQSMFLSRNKKK